MGVDAANLLSLRQTHSAHVVVITDKWDSNSRPQGDAMVTNQPGIALGILTADCVPVLFADRKNGVIGAAHSGWKGAISGILQHTIHAMIARGATHESIACAIGPAIARDSYEVGPEFRETFMHKSADNAAYFVASIKTGYWLFDLKQFVYAILADSGINSINMLENDTYLEEDAFFSYRRATHRGEADYGRQISVIMLKP